MGEKKDRKFISERIIGRELTFQRACKYLVLSFLCGIVFGGAFFAVNFFAGKKAEEETQNRESMTAVTQEQTGTEWTSAEESLTEETLPQAAAEREIREKETVPEETEASEEEETEQGSTGETEAEPEENGSGPAGQEAGLSFAQQKEIRELLEKEQKAYEAEPSDLGKLLMTQTQACSDIEKYLVKVVCTISEITWFESTVETQRQNSGIIVGVTDSEILVLTVKKAVTDSGVYQVVFHNGTRQAAVMKKVADRDGWAMFAVSKEGLGTEFAETLEAVKILPLSKIVPGVPVITAGSPMGVAGSYGFGYLNYTGPVESIMDGSICSCYTEAASDPENGTFLMSQSGFLIGLAVNQEEESKISGNRFVAADSCSSMIESLKKGYDQAKLGITGMDISFDMKYKNIPEGMYVTNVEENSPAFQAGLKRGDIIVMIGSREIRGLSDYCNFMRNLRPEETVKMMICRGTVHSDYKELELILTAGTR